MKSFKISVFGAILLFLCMVCNPAEAKKKTSSEVKTETELPAVEITALGVNIYPQRMSLRGEETLMDLLQLYPGQLNGGFDNVLDQFSLKVDDKLILGNIRNMLNKVLAKDVSLVSVVDNPSVSDGVAGMGGVIVVKFLHHDGLHGNVGAEVANSGPGSPYPTGNSANILPSAMVNYAKGTHVLTSVMDYGHSTIQGTTKETETAMMNYLFKPFKRDLTSLSLSQKYSHTSNDAASSYVRTFQSTLKNIHQFDDRGLRLMTQLYYLHNNSPIFATLDGTGVALRTKMHIPGGQATINIPLPVEGMNYLMGYKFQFVRLNYNFDADGKLQLPSDTPQLPIDGNFDISSHHVWGYLSYVLPKWKFDIGCRTIMSSYRSDMSMGEVKKRSNTYWLGNVSAIYMPNYRQQIQLAYIRRYFNPSYANFDLRDMLSSTPLMTNVDLYDDKFRNTQVDQVKLSYHGQWNQFSLHGNMGYIHLDGFVKPTGAMTQWVVNDTWMGEALACWHGKLLNILAGASYYTNEYRTNDSSSNVHTPYAIFRLVPTLFLPSSWQVRLQTMFYTKQAPLYQLTDNPVYASLRVNKQLGKHLDLYAQWHDIFYGSHGYILGGIDVRF